MKPETPIKIATWTIGLGFVGSMIGLGTRDYVNGQKVKAAETLRKETDLLQERGLLGEHPIVDLREVPGYTPNGEMIGGFSFVDGAFGGKPTRMLEFAWKPNSQTVQISSIPAENARYLIFEDPNTKSTIQFSGIKPEEMINNPVNKSWRINDFVNEAADEAVIFTFSRANWEKFGKE